MALLSRLTWLVAIIGLAVIALSLWGNLTARNTARRRTRAYLAVRPGAAPRLDTDWTDATIIVKNHGTTPALNVDHAVTLMMFDYPELPLDNVIGAADKLFGRKSIMLAPGAEITLPLRTVLSDDEKHETEDGTHKRLCAIGEVRYADAFKTPRFVRFCFMYGGAEIIARHARSYEREDFVFDPLHYLALLERKIGALDQAAPLVGWQLPEEFATLRRLLEARMGKSGKREFVQVLRLLEVFRPDDVLAGIRAAIARGVIGFDAVKHLVLCRIERRPPRLDLKIYPYLPQATVSTTSARSYLSLLAGGAWS